MGTCHMRDTKVYRLTCSRERQKHQHHPEKTVGKLQITANREGHCQCCQTHGDDPRGYPLLWLSYRQAPGSQTSQTGKANFQAIGQAYIMLWEPRECHLPTGSVRNTHCCNMRGVNHLGHFETPTLTMSPQVNLSL